MSNTHLTQCPHCRATFKVQDQHLSAAGGKVRCGSCLEVFNALDSLVKQSEKESATKPAAPTPNIAAAKPRQEEKEGRSPFELPEELESVSHKANIDKALSDDDDLIFADDPDEDRQDESYTGPGTFSSELSDSFLEIDTNSAEHFSDGEFIDDIEDTLTKGTPDSDESWAEQMLEDETEKHKQPAAKKSVHAPKSDMSDILSDEFAAIDEELTLEPSPEELETEFQPEINESETFQATEYDKPENVDLSLQYQNLRIDPAEHSYPTDRTFLGSLVWSLLNLGLLVVLLAQLAWFHYDKLAQYDQLRPIYQQACALAGCQLPDLVDTSKIRSQNLIVRSHPTARRALIFDAVIINQAAYEQPFPNLALYFSDLNNKVIAQRLFEPSDYLAGDIKNWSVMPQDTPIHISLEIIDPGSNAVNYSVGFFKHTSQGK